MILLLENMLSMLKKKLESSFFIIKVFLFIFIFFLYCNYCFCLPPKFSIITESEKRYFDSKKYYEQGKYVKPNVAKDIEIGMMKLDIAGYLGKPFIRSKDSNAWCYCFYESTYTGILAYRFVVLYFDINDILNEFYYLDAYDGDHKYKS